LSHSASPWRKHLQYGFEREWVDMGRVGTVLGSGETQRKTCLPICTCQGVMLGAGKFLGCTREAGPGETRWELER
jgi:hypothetical protein